MPELSEPYPRGEKGGARDEKKEAPRVAPCDLDDLPTVPQPVQQMERIENEAGRSRENGEHHGERVRQCSRYLAHAVLEQLVEQNEADEERRPESRIRISRPELHDHQRIEAGDDELEGQVLFAQIEGRVESLEERDHRQDEECCREAGCELQAYVQAGHARKGQRQYREAAALRMQLEILDRARVDKAVTQDG